MYQPCLDVTDMGKGEEAVGVDEEQSEMIPSLSESGCLCLYLREVNRHVLVKGISLYPFWSLSSLVSVNG